MPTCREVSRLLASDEVDAAPAVRRVLTRLHFLMCDDCTRYASELRQLGETARRLLRTPLDPDRLAALEQAILAHPPSGGAAEPPAEPE